MQRIRGLIARIIPHWHHNSRPRVMLHPEIEHVMSENRRVGAQALRARDELLRAEDEVIRRRGVPQ